MREEKITDTSKLKKRKLGRQQKTMGDLALMILSLQDAQNYYKNALETINKTNDHLWVSCTQESLAAIKFFMIQYSESLNIPNPNFKILEEIEETFREALVSMKKSKFVTLEIECFFKIMHFRRDTKDKQGLNKTVNIFLKTFDPEQPQDKCKFFVFVAQLYAQLGMYRKQAYYLKLAAQAVSTFNPVLCAQILKDVTTKYKIGQLFGGNFDQEANQIFWPSMQFLQAEELLKVIPDKEKKNHIQIQMVQMFFHLFQKQQIIDIFQGLNQSALNQQNLTNTNLNLLPLFTKMQIISEKQMFRKIQHKVVEQTEKQQKDIFIVNPWANKKKHLDSTFPANQLIILSLSYSNPLPFDYYINTLEIETNGCACITYPTTVFIPNGAKNCELVTQFKPIQPGQIKIEGVRITFLNYTYLHTIDDHGFFSDNESTSKNELYYEFKNLQIIEQLPNIKIEVNRQHLLGEEVPIVLFDESEVFTYQISLENLGNTKVNYMSYELIIEADDPPIFEYKSQIEIGLAEYSNCSLVFVEESFKETIKNFDEENTMFSCPIIEIPMIKHQPKNIKKISLICNFSHDDTSLYTNEVKVIRLVQIQEVSKLKACQFISKFKVDDEDKQHGIKEVYDLQDACYLSLEIYKQSQKEMISYTLNSNILLEGSFQKILNEETNHLSRVLKLKKLSWNNLLKEDIGLQIQWKSLFRNQYGILRPFEKINVGDIKKHCCKDLFEITAKEVYLQKSLQNVRIVNYTLDIRKCFQSEILQVTVSVSNDIGLNQNSQRSIASTHTLTNKSSSIISQNLSIIDGSVSFTLKPNFESNIELFSHQAQLMIYFPQQQPQRSQWGLIIEIVDIDKQVKYTKKGQIK